MQLQSEILAKLEIENEFIVKDGRKLSLDLLEIDHLRLYTSSSSNAVQAKEFLVGNRTILAALLLVYRDKKRKPDVVYFDTVMQMEKFIYTVSAFIKLRNELERVDGYVEHLFSEYYRGIVFH